MFQAIITADRGRVLIAQVTSVELAERIAFLNNVEVEKDHPEPLPISSIYQIN